MIGCIRHRWTTPGNADTYADIVSNEHNETLLVPPPGDTETASVDGQTEMKEQK